MWQPPFITARTTIEAALGNLPGAAPFHGFGQRDGIGTGASGEDIWMGSAVSVPTPGAGGEALELVSTDANDTVSGSGVRTVRVHYLDANGEPQTTDRDLSGTLAVALVPTDVRFVQKIHSIANGWGNVAAGDITIRNIATPLTVYNFIALGGNMSLTPHRMVPAGKRLIITSWHASEANGKRVNFRLRATAEDGELFAGTFLFKDSMYLSDAANSVPISIPALPALSIVKISG